MPSHPDTVARLLRPRSTFRDHSERGSRDHEAMDWEDAAAALAGASPVAYQAFQLRHSEDPPGRELVQHLLRVAERALAGSDHATPEQLVALLLREERAPEHHRREVHRYTAAGVTRGAWRYSLARPYARIAAEVDMLVSDAWRVARRRLDAA